MMLKVKKYCVSLTENENLGGTKKKSKLATLNTALKILGPRPNLIATKTVANKYNMMTLAKSKIFNKPAVMPVTPAQIAIDQR